MASGSLGGDLEWTLGGIPRYSQPLIDEIGVVEKMSRGKFSKLPFRPNKCSKRAGSRSEDWRGGHQVNPTRVTSEMLLVQLGILWSHS